MNGLLGPALKVGVAGLVLTYTQQITGLMNWAVRMACEVRRTRARAKHSAQTSTRQPGVEAFCCFCFLRRARTVLPCGRCMP